MKNSNIFLQDESRTDSLVANKQTAHQMNPD
jgi:hypothetical protein